MRDKTVGLLGFFCWRISLIGRFRLKLFLFDALRVRRTGEAPEALTDFSDISKRCLTCSFDLCFIPPEKMMRNRKEAVFSTFFFEPYLFVFYLLKVCDLV